MVFIITIGCIIGMAFLVKYANKHVSRVNYVLVFIAGLINLFLVPSIPRFLGLNEIGVAFPLASVILGIYFIGWAIYKLIKFKKTK